jgi:outer membrane lipoprotein SlyB
MNKLALIVVLSILIGCAATNENLHTTAYKAQQVNRVQAAKSIKIISVSPIKIEVGNSQAQFASALLSAATRGMGGRYGGVGSLGTMGTTIEGGSIGNSTGLMIPDKVLVDGVSISYLQNEKVFTFTQAGRACKFHPGTTIIMTTDVNETRIQPNASCAPEK